ncbi:MAG: hypothetical protein PVI97_00355 [Candidatus Thiodiazotropha sp.]|jgi:hypothetical protein
MVQLRRVKDETGDWKLQYRTLQHLIDAAGALNVSGVPEWNDWVDVPDVLEDDAGPD